MCVIIMKTFLSIYLLFTNVGEVSLTKYRTLGDRKMTESFRDLIARSQLECCLACEYNDICISVSYQRTTGKCLLSTVFEVGGFSVTDPEWRVYYKDEWVLLFRGVSGVGSDPYFAWLTGSNTTHSDPDCAGMESTACSQHFRSQLVNLWETFGNIEVKYAIYRNQAEVAYIIFDGADTDLENWFNQSRVISSSWPNLKTGTYLYFSMAGNGTRR